MASWLESVSGLATEEMTTLVSFVDGSRAGADAAFRRNKLKESDRQNGAALFAAYCAACHGEEAQGDVALALSRPDLLRVASDRYLYETMIVGRPNAGMPAWTNLEEEEVYDVLKYLRGYGNYAAVNMSLQEGDAEEGKILYHFNCSRCHGEAGQGQTGPALIDKDFLASVEDAFLY